MKFEFNRKEYERKFLNAGGYIGKIVNVTIENEVISVYFDIEQGDFKGVFMKEYKANGGASKFDASKWSKKGVANFNFAYSGAKYAFAQLLDDLETSNQSFKWKDETDDLKNKLIGIVYRKNIYTDKFGDEREGTDFPEFKSVKDIMNGNYSIEPKDKQKESQPSEQAPKFDITEDDIEF